MSVQRLITLHAPLARDIALPVLRCVENHVLGDAVNHVWLSVDDLPNVVVMADIPEAGDDEQ